MNQLVPISDVSLWPSRAKLRKLCEHQAARTRVVDAVLDKLQKDEEVNVCMMRLREEAHALFLLYTAFKAPDGMNVNIGDTENVVLRKILDDESGIKFRVDEAVLKKYYRKLAHRYHPDVGTNPDAILFGLAHAAYKAEDLPTLYNMMKSNVYAISAMDEDRIVRDMISHMEGVIKKFESSVPFRIAACYMAGGTSKATYQLVDQINQRIRACQILRLRKKEGVNHAATANV